MNSKRLSTIIFWSMVLCCISPSARADLILDFSQDGLVTSFTVDPGATIEIPIFLRQVGTGPFAPDITSDGLLGFGVEVDLDTAPGSATSTGFSISPPFIDLTASSVGSPSNLRLFGDNLGGVTGSAIELARVTVVGNLAGNVTSLSLSDPNPGGTQDFGTLLFGGIDAQVFSSPTTVSITTVPEPSSSMLLVLALPLARLFRRSRTAHADLCQSRFHG